MKKRTIQNSKSSNPPNPISKMQVKISNSITVTPSTPPFEHDHVLTLSHLDTDPNLNVSFRYLRVYAAAKSSTTSDPFNSISSSLSAALVYYYPLAATLRYRNDHRLELFCALGQGVPFITATASCSLESVSYLDDSDLHFIEQLVPVLDANDSLVKPCVLQVTVFDCGGFTLGAAIHHSLCDGIGGTQFFSAMAELARGADNVSVMPIWERASLLGPRNPTRIEAPIHEFLSFNGEFLSYSEPIGVVVRECFHVSEECMEHFKSLLAKSSGLNFTTFEALGAFIWRAKVKASKVHIDETVKFAYSINIRKLIKPALPAGYWGNGCVAMYVKLSAKELIENPIWETAQLIKKSKSNTNDGYVRSFIDFQELHYSKGITAGKEVSGFTDWRHLGHSNVDFGWGGPVNVFPVSSNLLGSLEPCFYLPYSSTSVEKKDGFKVLVTLRETAMSAFKQDMGKFCGQEF